MPDTAPNSELRGPTDTDPSIEKMQINRWREMTLEDKVRLFGQLCRDARIMTFAGIRSRNPGISERECLLEYARITLGDALAERAYPELRQRRSQTNE